VEFGHRFRLTLTKLRSIDTMLLKPLAEFSYIHFLDSL